MATILGLPVIASADTAQDVFGKVNQTIVAVFTQVGNKPTGAFGSGVVVSPGQVVTACHAIGQNAGLWVHHNGNYYRAESAVSDLRRDICLIRVPGLKAPSARLGSSAALKQGQPIWSLGAPKSLDDIIGTGIVAGLYPIQDARIIKVTTPAYKGSSGAGLFNERSELVGILTSTTKSGANIQYGIPVEWIRTIGQDQSRYGFQPPRSLMEDLVNIEPGNIDNARVMTATNVDQEFYATSPKQERDRWNKAKRLLNGNDWAPLKEHAQAWTVSQPSSADAWMFLGQANAGLQDPEGMEAAFSKVVKLSPDNALAHYYLGNSYVFQGKAEQALSEYERAQSLQPGDHFYKDAVSWTSLKLNTGRQGDHATRAKRRDDKTEHQVALADQRGVNKSKSAPGIGRGLLIFAILFILSGLGIYVAFLINSAQRWGTTYPEQYRRGAVWLAGAVATAAFIPIFWIFF
ncbi:S1 family peptidase [Duganella vulcania]|uniref:Tetratricopeptide repeat protein n=1 Tax=Duganella vulcania TaxID=2692166 RepID=A0A845GJD4_9BURK|nr:serine protease [Duganella vulcania]MYM92769.1 tetratricopeptide repeat protein [Duganella vulcania]